MSAPAGRAKATAASEIGGRTSRRCDRARPPDVLQLAFRSAARLPLLPGRGSPRRAHRSLGAIDDEVAATVWPVGGIGVVDRDVGDPHRPHAGEKARAEVDRDLTDGGGEQVELVQPGVDHWGVHEGRDVGPRVTRRNWDDRREPCRSVDVETQQCRGHRRRMRAVACSPSRLRACRTSLGFRSDISRRVLPRQERGRACVRPASVEERHLLEIEVAQRFLLAVSACVQRQECASLMLCVGSPARSVPEGSAGHPPG